MKNRIGFKIIIAVLLFSSVITIISTSVQLYIDYKSDIARVHNYENIIRKSYLESMVTSVWMFDSVQMRSQLNGILNLQDIEYVKINSREGYEWSAGEIKSDYNLSKIFPLIYKHKGRDVLTGSLYVVIRLDDIYANLLNKAAIILAINAVKIFIISGFILLLFQYLVTRHLFSLSRWMSNLDIGKSFDKFTLNRKKKKSAEPDEIDEVVFSINTMQDKLKNYLQNFKQSEDKFRRLIENLADTHLFFILDNSGRIKYLSPSVKNVLGYDENELIDNFRKYITKNYSNKESIRKTILSLRGIKQPIHEFEIVHKNGSIHNIQIAETPVYDISGRVAGVEGLAYDVTEIKKMEKRFQQAQKMEAIGTLAGGIAHDFNNILNIIIGYSELVKEDVPAGSDMAENLDIVLQSGYRAKDTVKQILAFSHKAELKKIVFQPASVLREAVALLRHSIPSTIVIHDEIDPDSYSIVADPVQVHQIVMNLGSNAFHAMEEKGGEMLIYMKNYISMHDRSVDDIPAGEYIELGIKDTGCGIPSEIKDRIFDPFFTTKEIGKGTGMGLSIVQGIVSGYGGIIKVESAEGCGTTFRIFFPATERKTDKGIDDAPVQKGSENILLVDDEELLLQMSRDMLSKLGYQVTIQKNSLQALSLFRESPYRFDLVITDQTMPGMTGADLARQMLKIRPDIPIILCTGYSTVISEDKAKSIGIREFAFKPLIRRDIARIIRKVLDN